MDDKRLRDIPLFGGLSRKELKQVAKCADEVDLDEGRELVREGDFSYEFFAIESGRAEVRHGDRVLAELGPGDFFGEMGLMEHAKRSASVVATSPLTAIVMTGPAFRQIGRELPQVAERVRTAVEERGRTLSQASG